MYNLHVLHFNKLILLFLSYILTLGGKKAWIPRKTWKLKNKNKKLKNLEFQTKITRKLTWIF